MINLHCVDSKGDEGDNELVKVGSSFEWLENSFLQEVDERIHKGDPGGLIAKRYPSLFARKKARMSQDEEDEEEEEEEEEEG